MAIQQPFVFSQASLQAYVDCPRLFDLRYLRGLEWPTSDDSPTLERERRRRSALEFHRMVARECAGVDPDLLSRMADDPDLAHWWANYRAYPPRGLPPNRQAEVTLSAPLVGDRLIATYDVLAVAPGQRALIVDWKTYARRPDRALLAARLQTRVYSYLFTRAGYELNGGVPPQPHRVEMVYWFAEFPEQPERFPYSTAQFEADQLYLEALVESIRARPDEDFPQAEQSARCSYCEFAPVCDRYSRHNVGIELDSEAESDVEPDVSFDFAQIAEIAY